MALNTASPRSAGLRAVLAAWQLAARAEAAQSHAAVCLLRARVGRRLLRRMLHTWQEAVTWDRLRRDAYPMMCR